MDQCNTSTIMIGTGPYDTALAIIPARNGHGVVLWDHNPEYIVTLGRDCRNVASLPDVPFSDTLHFGSDLAAMLAVSRNVLAVVPSHVSGEVLCQIKPLMRLDAHLMWVIKGLEAGTGRLLQDVTREALSDQIPLAVISGLMFVKEPTVGLSAATSLASTDQVFAGDLQQLLCCSKSFCVYNNPNFTGVQLGDTVKNVIVTGAGIPDGIGFGANACMTLITRRLAEMSRLGVALDTNPAISMGMMGLGDLVLTYTDNQPRNRRLGMMLGQSVDVQNAQEEIGQVVEGYHSTKEVRELTHRFGVEMPITKETYQVLYCKKNVREVVLALLGRAREDERSSH